MARLRCASLVAMAVAVGAAMPTGVALASSLPRESAVASAIRPGNPVIRPVAITVPGVRDAPGSAAKSTNWAGYVVSRGAGTYRSVSASWTEPTARCTSGSRYAAFWVGLDGYSDQSVEQAGTVADCVGKTAEYQGWYEMYPSAPVFLGRKVRPRDHLSASVTFRGTETYILKLRDSTRGWTRTITRKEPGLDRSSAEVVSEAPSSQSGVLALADFGIVNFAAASANATPLGRLHPTKIVMIDGSGRVKDTASAISSAGAFHDTWVRLR